jgi:hypothetical protein
MNNKMTVGVLAMVVLFSGCKTMETANKKMDGVNKTVIQADAKFRQKVGLPAYKGEQGGKDKSE